MSGNQAPFSDDITNFSVAGVECSPGERRFDRRRAAGNGPGRNRRERDQRGRTARHNQRPASRGPSGRDHRPGRDDRGQHASKSVTGAGQAVQSSEANFAAAGTSWLGSIFSAGTSLFVRGGFVALGLVLILGAFVFFYAENKQGGVTIA